MTNQAVAGLTAGLLTQPRFRKGEFVGQSEREEINMLRAKVRELYKTVEAQNKLIEIFKSMPDLNKTTVMEIKEDATLASAGKTRRSKKDRNLAQQSRNPKGQPEDDCKSIGRNSKNGTVVEEGPA
jgi:hypothetical protein